jgi:hypothetical protein
MNRELRLRFLKLSLWDLCGYFGNLARLECGFKPYSRETSKIMEEK